MNFEDFIEVRREDMQRNQEAIEEMRNDISILERENRGLRDEIERAKRADKDNRWKEFQEEFFAEME